MEYYSYHIEVEEERRDIVMAFLTDLPFDSFQETEAGMYAYLPVKLEDEELNTQLNLLAERWGFTYEREYVPGQNWNEKWEANFQPILIDDFCVVRAPFHARYPAVEQEITIMPKMAFGTGHHATTYMMMDAMRGLDFVSKEVLDYGCGTGILAILAEKRGASRVDAVDIEAAAYENTLENAALNQCQTIQAVEGVLSDVAERKHDIILANINRNVILESLETLYGRLKSGGVLLVSGILRQDEGVVKEAAARAGFIWIRDRHRGDWCCLHFGRK